MRLKLQTGLSAINLSEKKQWAVYSNSLKSICSSCISPPELQKQIIQSESTVFLELLYFIGFNLST